MLHGLGGDSGQLWPYAGGDAARSRLAPDLRAHGATMLVGQRRSFTFGGLTRDLAALLDRLRFPPSVVVGMSMGAGVAAGLALRQPCRVRGLVLIRPAWLDVTPPVEPAAADPGRAAAAAPRSPGGAGQVRRDRRVRPRPGAVTGRRGQPRGAVPRAARGPALHPAHPAAPLDAAAPGPRPAPDQRADGGRRHALGPAAPVRDSPDLGVRPAGQPPGDRARARRGPGRISGLPDRGVRPARRPGGRRKASGGS